MYIIIWSYHLVYTKSPWVQLQDPLCHLTSHILVLPLALQFSGSCMVEFSLQVPNIGSFLIKHLVKHLQLHVQKNCVQFSFSKMIPFGLTFFKICVPIPNLSQKRICKCYFFLTFRFVASHQIILFYFYLFIQSFDLITESSDF